MLWILRQSDSPQWFTNQTELYFLLWVDKEKQYLIEGLL